MGVRKAESRLATQGPGLTFGIVFLLANAALFWWGVMEEYGHQTSFRRFSSVIARGFGFSMNLNIGLILLLASRKFMTLLRRTPLNLIFPFDEAMPKYHAAVGIVTFVSAILHGFFHVVPGVISADGMSPLWSSGFGGWTFSVASGFLVMLVFTVMMIALRARKPNFELFYWIHLIGAAAFIVIVLLHGKLNGLLYTYRWITAPLAIYLIDRCYRNWHSYIAYAAMPDPSATGFDGDILKLAVPKCFEYRAGQYADVMIPSLSRSQWHPFTIASAPHEPELRFYIKSVGDWTKKLYALLEEMTANGAQDVIEVHIRGPYGAPAQHVGQFDSVVLISGGVGATPFCSIVKNAVHIIESPGAGESIDKIEVEPFSDIENDASACSTSSLCKKASINPAFVTIPMNVAGEKANANNSSTDVLSEDPTSDSSLGTKDLKPRGSRSSIEIAGSALKVRRIDQIRAELDSIFVSYGALWLTFARYFSVCIALITFHGVDLSAQGFRVLPKSFLIVDLVLLSLVMVPVVLSIVLDAIRTRRTFLFDVMVTVPVLMVPMVLHILSLARVVPEAYSAYPKLFFYFLLPATGLALWFRHVKRAGELWRLAPGIRDDITQTRSLDFIYTTPTSVADDWLVNELKPLSYSKIFRMHRFITRESKPDFEEDIEKGIGRFENNYGRPDWEKLFESMVRNVPSGSSVGIFFCGPPAMEDGVRDAANAAMLRSTKRSRNGGSLYSKARGCSVRILVKAENF